MKFQNAVEKGEAGVVGDVLPVNARVHKFLSSTSVRHSPAVYKNISLSFGPGGHASDFGNGDITTVTCSDDNASGLQAEYWETGYTP
ncbi:hypothetical protein SKAU_G00189430 [Synaphobranchus kaupii]|uniref:Uncharacterized protein n=1 Tax=Synaphobranchus kaupii TaxID=118154 RepID=A0A9Q1FDE0_SYNKA|nr:hypothetical protein SKAU_G00189430 [Synaphobranchus kaupii]